MVFIRRIIYCIKRLINRIMSSPYPLPVYHFIVEWGGTRSAFTEVSGLNIIHDVVDYKEGNSPIDSSIKIPGRTRFDNIILKRGIIKGDTDFFDWMKTKQSSQIQRRDVLIKLLDEVHQPVMTWKVRNAFPVKYTGPALIAKSSEVAIETLELAHEGIDVES